jgi:hypothetical protein
MTDITDDVIEDALAVGFGNLTSDELRPFALMLHQFAKRQRERQAVVVPDDDQINAAIAKIGMSESRPLGQQWDSVFTLIRQFAAPPADTVKQNDAMRKAGEELLAAYTEPFPMGTEGQEAQDAWGLRQKNAVEAMRQALANNGDCPHPIEEELTK